MRSPIPWHTWRAAVLPTVESILGRPITQRAPNLPILPFQQLIVAPATTRYLSNSHVKRIEQLQHGAIELIHKEIKDRKQELDRSDVEQYPRITTDGNATSLCEYVERFQDLKPGEKHEGQRSIRLSGRVSSIRKSGSKLAFIDIYEEPGHHKVQLMLNLGHMSAVDKKAFSNRVKLITRGDIVSAEGTATRTASGELSLLADSLPTILSPCLHRVPLTAYQSESVDELDTRTLGRHVEMLLDQSVVPTMVARSKLIKTMREFFDNRSFIEVQTPILAGAAGGATARPFETNATEFEDRKLSLRIAPELWLKRLVLGGMSKIYELGVSFRNEGLDQTHNPEFTTCEFYAAYHTLSQLQQLTEDLLRSVSSTIHCLDHKHLKPPPPTFFAGKFPSIDFIPALNTALGITLPNLSTPTARGEIIQLFQSRSIPLPSKPTLPRLLDKLSARYLEPQCQIPTWIINTPECLSPLAKSYIHPTCPNNQPIAARAELFIHHREVVNCYEEENSPFEQRRKFIDQQRYAGQTHFDPLSSTPSLVVDEEAHKIDHDYLRALEWGLPPTGGWGCGIDRLTMLFTGKEKIGDVLSFGNLRAVTKGAERYSDRPEACGK